jgi:predicted CXXCH cytochrome family protein
MTVASSNSRWIILALGVGLAIAAVAWWFNQRSDQEPQPAPAPAPAEKDFPIPPYSASRYLNSGPEARYIGTQQCIGCHRDRHSSYLLTAHSRALADVNPANEPPDGAFDHRLSGRSYRVYRRDGQLRHEEIVRTADGKEIARVDFPVRFVVGSGNHTRTYLVEADGFLLESPITWYAGKKNWDMSPGYDFPQHWGFERPVPAGCLACHSGNVELAAGTMHRFTFHEKAIGCESCHGPGSVHIDWHRTHQHVPGQEDLTIVNPKNLSRPQLESICSACHLNGPAAVLVRGRKPNDFRPGMPLTDYRIDYRFDTGGEQMTVVGHVEQLRQSTCYKKSKSMSCLTCHDPHAREKPADLVANFRQACVKCHESKPCREKTEQRAKKADNCMTCHMPRGDTDIPHVALTHHRIGKHTPAPSAQSGRTPELVPISDDSHLPTLERQRNLGLAYLEASRNPQYARYAEVFRARTRSLLENVHDAGLRDGDVAEALAESWWKRDHERTADYARQAVEAERISPEARALALILEADSEMQERDFSRAAELLKVLVKQRRYSEDWQLLGVCYLEQGFPHEALPALQQAFAIKPYRPDVHGALSDAYRKLGDTRRAEEHLQTARWLFEHHQR